MLEIVKYEVERGILTVGFKDTEKSFVVYTSIAYDATKQKNELLQLAYLQARDAIEYERTLNEHSLTTTERGEHFTPEPPKPSKITIHCDDMVEFGAFDEEKTVFLNAEIRDQYGDPYEGDVTWTASYGTVTGNVLFIPKVTAYTEISVTAHIGQTSQVKVIRAFPYEVPPIVDESLDDEMVAMAEAIIDLDARLKAIEGGSSA